MNRCLELVDKMLWGHGFNVVPPPGHLSQSTDFGSDTKRALTAKFYGDETERFIAGRNEGKLRTTEDIRR
jgi:hypothetical protein